jgi:hypothetical protein
MEKTLIIDLFRVGKKYTRNFNYHVVTPTKNLARWFKTIKNDRDYDDHYIWEILKVKLTHQAEYFRKHGHTMSADYNADKMMLCVSLINKVATEYYSSLYMDYHVSNYNWVPEDEDADMGDEIIPKEELTRLEIDLISERFDEFFKLYPHAYREVTKTDKYIFENDEKQKIAMNMGYYLHKKANKLLFKILEEHLQSWWD